MHGPSQDRPGGGSPPLRAPLLIALLSASPRPMKVVWPDSVVPAGFRVPLSRGPAHVVVCRRSRVRRAANRDESARPVGATVAFLWTLRLLQDRWAEPQRSAGPVRLGDILANTTSLFHSKDVAAFALTCCPRSTRAQDDQLSSAT